MPVTEDPRVAGQLAQFGRADNPAASIKYNVPLPGAYSFQRVAPMEISADWFTDATSAPGTSLSDLGVAQLVEDAYGGEALNVDGARLATLYQRMLPSTAQPSLRLAAKVGVGAVEPQVSTPDGEEPQAVASLANSEPRTFEALGALREDGRSILDQGSVDIQRLRREQFLNRLAQREEEEFQPQGRQAGAIQVPVPALGQGVRTVEYDLRNAGTPQIAIVEFWQLASFLGDYGLGRTLQTFSLLPGEHTTITLETWRTDAAAREDASSIFDSSDAAAQSRFSAALTLESGSAFQDQGGWALSVGTKVSGGFNLGLVQGSASLEAGFAANHQEARQQFSNSVSQTSQEHASQVNSSRRQAVDTSSSATTTTGATQSIVREISNTNLRRVLNFVFRELNQTYETITSLRDVRIAFYNGNVGSATVVPLADLRRLLREYIVPERQEELARTILAMVAQCIDHEGNPQTMLQVGERAGGTYNWTDATLRNDGTLDFDNSPLDGRYNWRIKRSPIGQEDENESRNVPGVVMAKDTTVLRTDNIVVEALLGQADALDPYASALQASDLQSREANVEEREAETRRMVDALNLVRDLPNDEKVDAFERILGEKPDIEVVPVAAVSKDGNGQ